jgi:hypothetical protein
MSRLRLHASLACLSLCLSSIALIQGPAAVAQEAPAPAEVVKAGYGAADATWHVGAGAGQYSAKSPDQSGLVTGGDVDPQQHSATQKDSYGVQSRLSYRAIVTEDAEGDQVAFVKSDSYLAQDYLTRRVGQLLDAAGSEVSYEEIMLMASHNHSSPYYTSPSWGVWVFQDAFDLRAFEYHARSIATAILEAEANLVPARMGATTIQHDIFKGIIQRAGIAEDGTPKGYPASWGDHGLVVIRFDDISDPANPTPLASLVNWGQHPESLDDHDLITGDFVTSLERYVERGTGAPMVFSQGDVGSSEAGPGQPGKVPDDIPMRWSHAGHANAERGGYYLAQDVIKGWNEIGAGNAQVPFSSDFDVAAGNAFVPGPLSHPYPSVSNCRTHTTAEGDPGAPVAGFPDCARAQDGNDNQSPLDVAPCPDEALSEACALTRPSMLFENLKAHGIPVPEHYDAPSFTGVEENMRLKLQAFKLGEVLMASCACEAQADLILNLESRADDVEGNIWDGFDWREKLGCAQNEDTSWTCDHPSEAGEITFSNAAYERMVAHIHNDAAGWDAPEYVPYAGTEPSDPTQIKGNFTKEELPADLGYTLPVGVGHASDYNGYTVSYREYMTWDDYRKALTSYGPHAADYMNTRLVRLAGELNGGPALEAELNDPQAQADEARQVAVSTALGQASGAAFDAWMATLPDDVGPAEALTQPEDIKRFDASTFSWRGGSNAADNPVASVERLVDGEWEPYADQSGEVQTMLQFPKGADGLINTYSGGQEWIWTANFEAFNPIPVGIGSTPVGDYRFVVDGNIRQAGADTPYHLESEAFHVGAWDGIEVTDMRLEPDVDQNDSVSFVVPTIVYPETYESPFRYVGKVMQTDNFGRPFCMQCSFRPWALGSEVESATVTVVRKNGKLEYHEAELIDGRWVADTKLKLGETAYVDAGDVVDEYGETNGERSTTLAGVKE